MKRILCGKSFSIVSAVVITGHAGIVLAHEVDGALGAGAGKTDFYQVSCSDGTGHLAFHVRDAAPKKAPKVSVLAFKGSAASTSTDNIDADANFGPEVKVSGGDGIFYVAVNKTGAAPENYQLEYHCESDGGDHTGTSIIQLQQQ